jgi:hypothetical protein
MNGRVAPRLDRALSWHGGLLSASLLFREHCRLQSVELPIVELLDRGGQVFRQNMPSRGIRGCPASVRWQGRRRGWR